MKRLALAAIAALMVSPAYAQFELGEGWVTGAGVYYVVTEGDNNYMVAGAVDGTDPKHAWVEGDFGTDYTVRTDIRLDSWVDAEDLSRAGAAVRIQPGPNDEGINILFHDSFGNIEFLNDLRGWATDTAFEWTTGEWYTIEIGIEGDLVTGRVFPQGDESAAVELEPWDSAPSGPRADGFPGVTASTLAGIQASFDNFMVMDPAGTVLFEDDFETPGAPIDNAIGLGPAWETGVGFYVVNNGVLYALADTGIDPKHAWLDFDFPADVMIKSDIQLLTWEDGEDLSRAGIAVRIQPGGNDEGINILFHDSFGNIEFLNDLRGWATDTAFDWTTGVWYTMELSIEGDLVSGSVYPRGDEGSAVALAPWDSAPSGARADGFVGITPSTLRGLTAAFDNFTVMSLDGDVLFVDDFESGDGSSSVDADWELFN